MQADMNNETGELTLTANSSAQVDSISTVPIGLDCADLAFRYDHPVTTSNAIKRSDCQLFFKELRSSARLTLRVQSTPGCISHSSVIRFIPFDKRLFRPSMWLGYAPADIRVTLFIIYYVNHTKVHEK